MKKNVLLLFVAFASLSMAFGQSLNVTSPYMAGTRQYDWGAKYYQQGAVVPFAATYDDVAADSAYIQLIIYDVSNWSVPASVTEYTDGVDGLPVDGIIDDELTIPEDFPLSDTMEALRSDWSGGNLIIFQTRVHYDPEVYAPAAEGDVYSNGIAYILAPYSDSVSLNTYNGYLGQVRRDSVFSIRGSYGIDEVEKVEVKLKHLTADGTLVSEDVQTIYSESVGVKSGAIYFDYPIPADFDLSTDFPVDSFIIEAVASYAGGSADSVSGVVKVVDVVMAEDVTISPNPLYVNVGHSDTLSTSVWPNDADDQSVTWAIFGDDIATVDAEGIVTATAAGSTQVVATTSNGITDTCDVMIEDLRPTGVSLDQTEATINVGGTVTLVATVAPENAEDKNVSWSSSDEFAASVDENGVVTGVGLGSATITVTTNSMGHTATCEVTVADATAIDNMVLEGVQVYPNPANDIINITGLAAGTYKVEIISLLGSQQVNTTIDSSELTTISISDLPSGTYLLKLIGEAGTFVQKINKY